MVSRRMLYGSIFVASIVAGNLTEKAFPGYGKDIMYGIQGYSGCNFAGLNLNPLEGAIVSFASNGLGEFAQYAGLFPGTFDPKDFVAYTVGAGISFGLEKIMKRRSA